MMAKGRKCSIISPKKNLFVEQQSNITTAALVLCNAFIDLSDKGERKNKKIKVLAFQGDSLLSVRDGATDRSHPGDVMLIYA